MRKIFTSLALFGVLIGITQSAQAQVQPLSDRKIKPNLSNPRFLVNNPANLAGLKPITLATWGSQLPTPLINAPVARGIDSLALLPLTNPAAISGKVCLLFRGAGVTFAQKVQYAVAAGAIGVIIVNNVPGEPAAMGNTGTATYTVPIVMVSDVDGNAINNTLRQSIPVNVSIGSWGLGATHDLAILPGFQSVPHAMCIPYSQLSMGAARQPYKNFVAGAVINYGTSAESNITVADSVVWTPTSGASSTVHQGRYNVPFISTTDSVRFGFGDASSSYSLPAPGSTGYYTYNYKMTYGNTDQYPEDNVYSYREYVTDSIFCKGTYDFTRNAPKITLGIQPGGASSPYCFGPLYYVADGKYAARKLQYTISMNGVETLVGSETYGLVYKWLDGSNAQPLDSFIQATELNLVGVAYRAFTNADSSGRPITLDIRDATVPTKAVILDSNSWYWTPAQATLDAFVGVDESVSYFTRAYEQSQVFNYQEHPEILYTLDYTNLPTQTGVVATFPFGGNALYVDSTFYDRFYFVPNIALHLSKSKTTAGGGTGAGVGSQAGGLGDIKVFPVPASDYITVDAQLNKTYKSVGYRLLDINGRCIYKLDKANIQQDKFTIPASTIPSGIYHLLVIADGDLTTRQVVIRK